MKKRALITGATSGIGRATALRLSREGYDVIATGRRRERLEELRREIEAAGAVCETLCFDVRDRQACERFLRPLGAVDLLVNNAGLAAGLEHIECGDPDDWDRMIDTNVKGFLYVTRIVAQAMAAAISSTSVPSPAPNPTRMPPYTALRSMRCTQCRSRCAPICCTTG